LKALFDRTDLLNNSVEGKLAVQKKAACIAASRFCSGAMGGIEPSTY